jgi:two-component system sensor histidine kinase DesK
MRLLPDDRDEGWTPYAWLIYIGFFAAGPLLKRVATPTDWALTVAGLVTFLALYFYGFWCGGRRLLTVTAAIALLGIVYWPFNPGAGSFFIYAAAFAGELTPTRRAALVIGIIEAIVIAEVLLLRISPYSAFWPILFCVLIGDINIHHRTRKSENAKLRLAHDEIEHLAKAAERERIARDLHDLLGHTLSVIILKSELASKLADRDAERARSEIRDVERISRDALAQVRAAVRGYREGSLVTEIDNARAMLATAGIEVAVDGQPPTLPAAQDAVLALAIREAATNIVRHAGARRCRIGVTTGGGSCVVAITDDGVGGSDPFGAGLSGMRERVEALGGTMVRDGGRGTTITIALPVAGAFSGERTA